MYNLSLFSNLMPMWKLPIKVIQYCNWLFKLAEEEDRLQDLMNIQELELEDSEEFQVQCQEYTGNMKKINAKFVHGPSIICSEHRKNRGD